MTQLNPMLQQFLGTLVRHALMGLSVWAVQHGIFSEADGVKYAEAGALAIVSIGWSLYQKYGSRQKLVTALAAPSGSSERDIEATIAAKVDVPSVTTPKDVPPVPTGSS